MEITQVLADYLVHAERDGFPQEVVHEARRSLINWLGCAVGGSRHEAVNRALAAILEFSGPRQATIMGRAERLDVLNAAMINGISSHVLDFDDTHAHTLIHPSGPVVSTALALAELVPVDGASFLHAIVLGIEAECRIGRAVFPSHYDVGWHITGTAGVFGAAAAAGRLLGLGVREMSFALGIAATQASGLREMFGTMSKSLHPGRAAHSGLLAALLAAKGFTSSERSLEAPRGFANVLAPQFDLAAITDNLGARWEILSNTYKPFACGLVNHAVIDGCLSLRTIHNLRPGDIEAVELKVNPLVAELTGNRTPATGLEGKFSIFHSAAVALVDGTAGEAQYSNARVCDPIVTELRKRVKAEVSSSVGQDEAGVSIRLKNGQSHSHYVKAPLGSLAKPLSDAQIEEKFHDLVEPFFPRDLATQLARLCWESATLADAGKIARDAASASALT